LAVLGLKTLFDVAVVIGVKRDFRIPDSLLIDGEFFEDALFDFGIEPGRG